MAIIDGPRLAARSGNARQLVVFLHGYGANGNDLIDIGREWQRWLPDAAFVSPHAPEPCPASGMGRQWFALTFRDPDERWRGVNHAAPSLEAFLDAELQRHGLTPDRLALVGFSQGTMMALHVGLRRRVAPAAIVGYSGILVVPPGGGAEPASRPGAAAVPPILLVHGEADEVIPVDGLFFSAERLAGEGLGVQWHLSPRIGHGIDGGGLRHGGLFLTSSFGLPFPEQA
ncbi:phospholipase/carboxylesterase [Pseudochelatococcus lubricantis]|uniref:Phospholipase/carboxylesterase n=1 Tax=Pseudochelatococcus lubricantis TaxID=1538102 RepID=A0ABX0UVB3_9HYPH|nr:phospholipase [Pseudochelatococcus lubricantis]NIJ56896.1 phospholipase/carboxylesterase [Pseudochelatococcus lubricantis]